MNNEGARSGALVCLFPARSNFVTGTLPKESATEWHRWPFHSARSRPLFSTLPEIMILDVDNNFNLILRMGIRGNPGNLHFVDVIQTHVQIF